MYKPVSNIIKLGITLVPQNVSHFTFELVSFHVSQSLKVKCETYFTKVPHFTSSIELVTPHRCHCEPIICLQIMGVAISSLE